MVGGQNGIDQGGNVVGDDVGTQSAQALRNVLAVLEEAGAAQDDSAQLTVYLVAPGGRDHRVRLSTGGMGGPSNCCICHPGLWARPAGLVEVSALALVS